MSTGTARLVFVVLLVVNSILWSRGRYGQPMQASLLHGEASLVKRISYELSQPLEARVSSYSENEVSPGIHGGPRSGLTVWSAVPSFNIPNRQSMPTC
jgi:hypothetical protein